MFCPKCGKEIEDNTKFCIHCGAPIKKVNNHYEKNPYSNEYQQPIPSAYIQPQNNSSNTLTLDKPKKRISNKGIIAIVVAIAIVLSVISIAFSSFSTNNETNTIMVYMVGSDLESQSGAASNDIAEMAKSGIDFNKNNVLVYAGGSSYWNLDIPTEYNSLIQISKDSYDIVATTDSPLNMGEPDTLTYFLQYCFDNYKTDNYSLILWNHGGGPLGGYGVDELYDGDRLMINELDSALSSSPFVDENKLDWIGFDACLMGSIEIADVMSNYSNYMIASQETEPGTGWDYSFLSTYNKTSDTVKIAENIIDSYFNSIENMMSSVFNPEITLSCLDLSKLDNTISAMDAFFEKLDSYLDLGGFATLARNRENTKAYGLSASSSKGDSYDLVDLGNLTENVVDDYQAEAEQLRSAIDDMVIYEKNNVNGCTGVSIYYPYDNVLYYDYLGSDLCKNYERSQGYRNYIGKFADMWLNGDGNETVDKAINLLPDSDSDFFSIQLTEEQLQNYSSAYYTVLEKNQVEGQDVYTPVLSNCKVEPDNNGIIKVSTVQDLFFANDKICLVKQTESSDEKANYVTQNSRLYNGNLRFDPIAIFEDISVSFTENSSGDISIQNILLDGDNETVSGKTTIDISNWEDFGYFYNEYIPKYNDENKLLPYTEWEENNWSSMSTTTIYDDTISFSTMPSNEYSQELVCQIVVEDCQGNSYASDLFTLEQNISTQSSVKTENGELVFDVYSDHAELVEYTGTDQKVEIPSNVEGKDVTRICGQVFDERSGDCVVNIGNRNITEVVLPDTITEISDLAFWTVTNLNKINLPEGLETIGEQAFFQTSLTSVDFPSTLKSIGKDAFCFTQIQSVNIPANVEKISDNPFTSCKNLTEFTVDKKNKNYTVVDGFLCTKDKKTLICGLNIEHVVIPKKIEKIGEYSFADFDSVKSIEFSKKVSTIGDYAFYNTSLSDVTLPEKLNKIGFCAFRNTIFDDLFADNVKTVGFTEITIPSTVTYIGEAAFSGQPISEFIVSEENNNFSATGQFLMNKNGEQLIACGGGIGGIVTIPESVKEIKYNAFEGCNKTGRNDETMDITEIIVPDSVVAIRDDLCITDLEKLTIGKNVIIWAYYDNIDLSADNSYYPEVVISKDNNNFSIKDGKVVKNENEKLTTFHLD